MNLKQFRFLTGVPVIVLILIPQFCSINAILNNKNILRGIVRQFPNGNIGNQDVAITSSAAAAGLNSQMKVISQASSSGSVSVEACKCMDYWDCVANNGQIYSYCGISGSEVCCFSSNRRSSKDISGNGDGNANNALINRNSKKNSSTTGTVVENKLQLPSSAIESIITTEISASADSRETLSLFETGNGNVPNSDDDVVITKRQLLSTTNVPDVDYFYTFEDGDDEDLKQITTTLNSADIAAVTVEGNYGEKLIPCGKQAINWKLDSNAEFREWPWHVALLEVKQDIYVCGGTLITPDRVLTAAHCLNPYSKGRRDTARLKVRVGEYDISTNSEVDPYVEALVERIVIHPGFNNATLVNDIAILKLRRPVNYTTNVRPICLPTHANDESLTRKFNGKHAPFAKCVVTGWGRTSENSSFSVRLKEIVVPLWNHTECQQKLERDFGKSYRLPETAICAGERGHDACDGDGGGSLSCFNENRQQWEIAGIVSFGIGCGRIDNPGVYTSVSHYTTWIDAFVYLQ